MSRKILVNILENTLQPSLSEAIIKDVLGSEGKVTTLVAQTTLAITFNEHAYQDITLGSAGVTVTAVTTGIKNGEAIILKITQDGTGARTVTFSTGFSNPLRLAVTPEVDAIDYYLGIVDGGSITLFNITPTTNTETVVATGSSQTDAADITQDNAIVTGGDATKGVILPSYAIDRIITVHHMEATIGLKIYPASGEKINGGTADAAVTITSAGSDTSSIVFSRKAAGDWYGIAIRGTLS